MHWRYTSSVTSSGVLRRLPLVTCLLLCPSPPDSAARRHLIALVSLATLLAGFAVTRAVEPVPVTSAPVAAATTASASARLTLRFDGHVATAVLDETPAAREFAALLPLTLRLSDPMGQAKSGPLLSGSLDVTDADRTFRTTAGQLAYWPPSATVAVVHDDLGQRVPAPGWSGSG